MEINLLYKDLLESAVQWNKRANKDRKKRIPFYDQVTGQLQKDNHIRIYGKESRQRSCLSGQLFTYPIPRWRVEKRKEPAPDAFDPSQPRFNGNSMLNDDYFDGSSSMLEDSADAWNHQPKERISHAPDYDESKFLDDIDDTLSPENPKEEDDDDQWGSAYLRRKERSNQRRRAGSTPGRRGRTAADKSYPCKECPRVFRSRQGLNYHMQSHFDPSKNSSSSQPQHHPSAVTALRNHQRSPYPPPMPSANHPPPPRMEYEQRPPNPTHPAHPPHPHAMPQRLPPPMHSNVMPHHLPPGMPPSTQNGQHPMHMMAAMVPPHPGPMPMSIANSTPISSLAPQVIRNNAPVNNNIEVSQASQVPPQALGPPASQQFQGQNNGQTSIEETRAIRQSYCEICRKALEKNNPDAEELVSCAVCFHAAHPSCLGFTAQMVKAVKTYDWQCIECKTCLKCGTAENDDKLLFCDECDRGYHLYCLEPPITDAPEGQWYCGKCIDRVANRKPAATNGSTNENSVS